ncbi:MULTISPECIES: phosphoribosyltransferase [Streptomyces]|uniref:Phosphoribosyltransferase n=1 Tax=Streptomyces koelreuteriae TaxID=2838015 RepID=A0ABX8FKD2_9ACTN|nr:MULTISPECIES: phosphoribosyltransferase family protein [Streptomyces]QWB21598.1 phosphoribosyltransferase [Streptomyces koelreuteriae]UUA04524.1 phosphoribosyltransferase [Streptomyces koelreuteriae]UUA12149.1 phosphoribosyltransferase [Streptomyces sp. CRCS-T-1]
MRFRDRRQAGRELAEKLRARQDAGALPRPLVLALPRGGVAVASEVAAALDAPLDVLVVRKIGAPYQEEYGVGAMAGDEVPLLDEEALRHLGLGVADLAPVIERERAELRRRERLYRQGRPAPDLRGRTVIVVDDGLATGSTARAALRSVRRQEPARVVLAAPVCSPEAAELMRAEADEVLCLHQPAAFMAVGLWYENFDQLTDHDVLEALHVQL